MGVTKLDKHDFKVRRDLDVSPKKTHGGFDVGFAEYVVPHILLVCAILVDSCAEKRTRCGLSMTHELSSL